MKIIKLITHEPNIIKLKLLSKDPVGTQKEILLPRDSWIKPSSSPAVVHHSSSGKVGRITSYSGPLDLFLKFWKPTFLSLLSSPPVFIPFLPQPTLHCSLKQSNTKVQPESQNYALDARELCCNSIKWATFFCKCNCSSTS